MSILVFSHEQDVDGIFSAAILRITFPECEVILTNYGLENMNSMAETIRAKAARSSGTVVIADIGINEESCGAVLQALNFSKARGWSNIWLDHHVWPEGPKQELSKVCELVLFSESGDGVQKCSAELCTERFAVENKHASQLAAMAHRTDFPDSAWFPIPPLTMLISYYLGFPNLRQRLYSVILENIVRGILWDSQMQADVIEASALIDASIARSIAGMTETIVDASTYPEPIKVAVAKAEPFMNRSLLLGKIMDESVVQLAIAYTDDGKLSIRRGDLAPSIDCSKIALEFKEGGGHVGAAGGFLHTNPQKSGDAAAVSEIISAVKSYFSKVT